MILVLLVGVGLLLLLSRQAKPPVLVSRTDPPKISFEHKRLDLGTVTEGVEIPSVYRFHNVGGEPLMIKSVTTSCGCTSLNLKDKLVDPGKMGELEVIMDTSMKQGPVTKEIDVYSNDPKNPETKIYLSANVVPALLPQRQNLDDSEGTSPQKPARQQNLQSKGNEMSMMDPHAGLTEAQKAKIFTGKCATCHVLQGKGKFGAALFQADCAMCHGMNAQGKEAPALIPGDYHDPKYLSHMESIIRYGSPVNISMPGFSKTAGGPLSDAQIHSILQYLERQTNEMPKPQDRDLPGG